MLASTKVDSIELKQTLNVEKQQQRSLLSTHLELKIQNLELKLTNSRAHMDLLTANLSDLGIRAVYNEYSTNNNKILTSVELKSFGQLSLDFCEYKFLTIRPLVDPLQFKIASTINLSDKNASLDISMDSMNILISQSALLTLKYLKNEWSTEKNTIKQPSFYRLHNDTSTPLNLKQLDTEETCLLKPGMSVPYTWRTHKKPQLMQLLMPKHFICSNGFSINKNGYQEIRLQFKNSPETSISCIINVTNSAEANYEKDIFFQSKIVFCNYLNTSIKQLKLAYISNGKHYEISSNEIAANSRSNSTHELIETRAELDIDTVRINEESVKIDKTNFDSYADMFSQMKRGILCKDVKTSTVKFWFSCHEQALVENESNNVISQFHLIVTPLFLFCSYLPYELNVKVSEANDTKQHVIKSNSVVHFAESFKTNEISVKFDQAVHSKGSRCEFECNDWYEKSIQVLDVKSLHVSECAEYGSKLLKYADLFRYKIMPNGGDGGLRNENIQRGSDEFNDNLSPVVESENKQRISNKVN